MADLNEKFLKSAICGLIDVTVINQGIEVTLPQVYATGHSVVVIVTPLHDGFLVHDNSYAAMLLERTGTKGFANLLAQVEPMVRSYGCGVDRMRVVRTCVSLDDVAISTVLVGSASRLIADQALSAEQPPIFDFRTQLVRRVSDVVGEKRVRRNMPVTGHLGSRYRIAATVTAADEKRPIAFIEPISDPNTLPRKFKEFYDIGLNADYADIERVTVLDDTKSFPPGDALLMQEVSTIVRYSDVDRLMAQWQTMH